MVNTHYVLRITFHLSRITFYKSRFNSPIPIIRRARALRGNHSRAERMLRRAARAKSGALVRLLQSLQDQPTDALGRFLDGAAGDAEAQFGVVLHVFFAQAQAALGNLADAAPLAMNDLKNLAND